MSSHGITDQVAIVSMGCTPFAVHWDKGADDLLVDAVTQTTSAVGLQPNDVDAYWLGTSQSGASGMMAAGPL